MAIIVIYVATFGKATIGVDTYAVVLGGENFHLGISMKKIPWYINMLNKNIWGVKKCRANQKQHCKQAGATKRFDIS